MMLDEQPSLPRGRTGKRLHHLGDEAFNRGKAWFSRELTISRHLQHTEKKG